MSLIWDIIQHSQISKQKEKTATLEQRVALLESDLHRTQENLLNLLHLLEKRFGEDLDGDGRIG